MDIQNDTADIVWTDPNASSDVPVYSPTVAGALLTVHSIPTKGWSAELACVPIVTRDAFASHK